MDLTRRSLALGAFATAALARHAWAASRAPTSSANALVTYELRLRGLAQGASVADPSKLSGELRRLTNRYRGEHGLGALAEHAGLARAARAHAADLADRGYFEHATPEGFTPSERVGLMARDLCGYSGENIVMRRGGVGQPSAREMLDQWITSPGHRANLLRGGYTHVGHGVAQRGDRTYAAAAYAREILHLAPAFPLHVATGQGLAGAVHAGAPTVDRFQLSRPDGSAPQGPWGLEEAPLAATGAWRLRPLVRESSESFQVLWGPIFFVD